MTRLQLAEEYAERARHAQQSGDHRSAAALFAEALQLLALPFHEAAGDVDEITTTSAATCASSSAR
jgi:hypothetical protein